MSIHKSVDKERHWREQIALSEKREGTLEAFCRDQSIAVHSLVYWRAKFKKAEDKKSKGLVASPFVSVQVNEPRVLVGRGDAPDAKWCAEFVLHLFEGRP
jgi:hypothetical protein